MTMKLHYIAGINSDRLEITLGDQIIKHSFGYTCSSNRRYARYAEEDHKKKILYGWKSDYPLKPYIGDIVKDLVETNYINNEDIEYSGYNVFAGRNMTEEEIKEVFDRILAEV